VVVAAVVGLLHSPLTRVRDVTIEGARHTPRNQILVAAGLAGAPRVLMIDAGGAAARHAVDALPWVASASFARSWPWTIVITVTERAPAALVPAGRTTDEVDASGRVLQVLSGLEDAPPLPVVTGALPALPGQHVLPTSSTGQQVLNELLTAAAAAPPDLARRRLQLAYSPASGLVARLGSAKALILLGDASNMTTKLAVLEELASTVGLANYSQVDLTVPQRPALTPISNPANG
jgi:cell division protein FtsQ